MIKLWHTIRTGDLYGGARNSNKIILALDEIGEPYTLKVVRRIEDVRPPSGPYRKLNPNGVVPTIDDDGFLLWESGAILRYLADSRPGNALMPEDLKGRALSQQWLTWEGATCAPSLLGLFFAVQAQPPSEQVITAARAAFLDNLRILDSQLSGRHYVIGPFSVADIALSSLTALSFALQLDLEPFPNILAWFKRLSNRKAFVENEIFCADFDVGAEQLAKN